MPNPNKGESKQHFISRCIPYVIDEGYPNKQAAAICYSKWRKKGGGFDEDIKQIIKKGKGISLSDLDVLNLVDNKAKVLLYKELSKFNTLDELLEPYGSVFILYETKPNYGHWTCLWRRNSNTINFFDPYGIFPDEELYWNDEYTRKYLDQNIPFLSYLLINSPYKNLEFNDHDYQHESTNINTCGRWCALRILLRNWSPEQFEKVFGYVKNPDDLVTLITEILSKVL